MVEKQTKTKRRGTTIVRAPHKGDYFIMARSTAQDRNVSFAARGMLTYLLSKPDGWRINIKDLQQGCGRDKVYVLIDELIEHRYIERSKSRTTEYIVREVPLPENTEVSNETGLPEKAEVSSMEELPENTYTAFQDTYILQSIENTESESTENTLAANAAPADPPEVPEPTIEKQELPEPPTLNVVPKEPPPSSGRVPPPKQPRQYGDMFVLVNRYAFKAQQTKLFKDLTGKATKALLHEFPDLLPPEFICFAEDWKLKKGKPDFPSGEKSLPKSFGLWRQDQKGVTPNAIVSRGLENLRGLREADFDDDDGTVISGSGAKSA